MDDLDYRLLARLRSDAREPVAKLAAALGVSRATVRSRIDRLVAESVILGFTITTRAADAAHVVRAIVMIEIEGQGTDKVIRRLAGFPSLRHLYTTNGRFDVVAEIETPTLEAFDDVLRQIRQVEGIRTTETNILLSARKGGF